MPRHSLRHDSQKIRFLDGTGDLAGSQACCANVRFPNGSVIVDPDRLNVRVPFSSGMDIRMGNLVSADLTLPANLALSRHQPHLLFQPPLAGAICNINEHGSSAHSESIAQSAQPRQAFFQGL